MDDERGSAGVEHAALVLLAALVACAVVALVAAGPERRDGSLAAAIAFKQRCAVRYPDPCWQDPLTEAYGRAFAGAVRALAPAPEARVGPDGNAVVGVDYRRCRQVSCAIAADQRLTTANRRTTAFTSIRDGRDGGGPVRIDLLDLPPDDRLGADHPDGRIDRGRRLRRHPAARVGEPGSGPARDAARARRRPLPRRRGAALAKSGREPLGSLIDPAQILPPRW